MIDALVLTQPAPRAAMMRSSLAAAVPEVVGWPMTVVSESPGIDWSALCVTLAACDWALFPSPGAIDVVMSALVRHRLAWPAATGVGLVGPGSVEALSAWTGRLPGLDHAAVIAPEGARHDAQALLARPEFASPVGRRIAVLRRADGREAWLLTLAQRGATVHAVDVYEARAAAPPATAASWLAGHCSLGDEVAFSVASADAGRRLGAFADGLPESAWVRARAVLVQHPRIAEALEGDGWRHVVMHRAGVAGLAAAIESLRTR